MKDKSPISPTHKNKIINVYKSNFIDEMRNISNNIKKFNYIGMDTEFPGTLYSPDLTSYQAIKQNVDSLKLIQVGITLSDKNGNMPLEGCVWQFNLNFSLKKDKFAKDSINMLTNCGIDFDQLEENGIDHEIFAEYLLSSGLVLNEELKWVCFHGIYDFAYLLKTITNLPLPESEKQFFDDLEMYFPTFYDIRYLIRYNENLKGSLNRLAQEINVKRYGKQHQAGSDSLITLEVFLKLYHDEYLQEESLIKDKNALFGISPTEPVNSEGEYNQFMMNFGIGQNPQDEFTEPSEIEFSKPINKGRFQQPQYDYGNINNSIYQMGNQNVPYGYIRNNSNNYYYPYQMMGPNMNPGIPRNGEEAKGLYSKKKWNKGIEE